jgi:hypothetical protein
MENLMQGYTDDPAVQQILTELALNNSSKQDFSLVDGIIRHKGRVWIGNNKLDQQHVLQAMHNSGIGGHFGFHATYHRLKALFSWPQMKATVRSYLNND